MTNNAPVVIIGAGPAGIAAGIALGPQALVLERKSHVGGLSTSIELDGAVFDLGGHSFHTPHAHVRNMVFDALEMEKQVRDARCYTYQTLIPYPFQKNFREINNATVVQECADGLANADGGADASNFEEFIIGRFGAGIANHFMLPYNRKIWGRDLKRLAVDWVGERVAAPEGVRERFDNTGGQRRPLQDNTSVAYPARGGFGEIFKALGRQIHDIRFNQTVKRINLKRREVVTTNGDTFVWENLISTMPIEVLFQMIGDVPQELVDAAARLEYLSLKVVLIVVGSSIDVEIQRVYSADEQIAPHKIALNHNSSNYLRSLPQHGIMAEVSYSDEKPLRREDLDAWVVENLHEIGLIRDITKVRTTKVVDVKYAYPVPTVERDAIVQQIKAWLGEHNIYTLGRFGEWAYINSDEALHRGLTLGHALVSSSEPTG